MSQNKRVLVVDDEPQITRVLRRSLVAHQYDVRTAADGASALDTFHDFHPNLVITDLQMPEMGGLELCREIRKISEVPIIVLSVKGEERQKVAALDAGADDYVTKPFGMNELVARVRATLRRTPGEHEESRLDVGDFVIDLSKHVALVRNQEVRLTPKEFELLAYLVRNHERSSPTASCSPPFGAAILSNKPSTCGFLSATSEKRSSPIPHIRDIS